MLGAAGEGEGVDYNNDIWDLSCIYSFSSVWNCLKAVLELLFIYKKNTLIKLIETVLLDLILLNY